MKATLVATLAAILAIVAGCKQNEEVYSISFRNFSGTELASGTISISGPLPAAGMTRGSYRLEMKQAQSKSKETVAFYQLFGGKESGRVEWTIGTPKSGSSSSNFDFMPGSADANIVAYALPTVKGRWRGRWSYAVFMGGHEGGSFEVARK